MMKKIVILIAMLFMGVAGYSQGIVFQNGTFDQMLAKATAEDKLVFVDFYTQWCGPCKSMAANVFTDAEVGDAFNKRFICCKIDAETPEGKILAKRYDVKGYPNMFFISGKGEVVYSILGGRSKEKFMEELDKVDMFSKMGSLESLTKKYEDGCTDMKFLTEFYNICGEELQPKVLNTLFLAMPDSLLFNTENKFFDGLTLYDSKVMHRLMDGLAARNSKDETFNFCVTFPVQYRLSLFLEECIENGDKKVFDDIMLLKSKGRNLDGSSDADFLLMKGRGKYFVSEKFSNLCFALKNEKDVAKVSGLVANYMDSILKNNNAVEIRNSTDSMFNVYKPYGPIVFEQTFESYSEFVDNTLAHILYYWRNNPSDKKTIRRCQEWTKFLVCLNPYSPHNVPEIAKMLVRLKDKKSAIKLLEDAVAKHKEFYQSDNKEAAEMRQLLSDLVNDKW